MKSNLERINCYLCKGKRKNMKKRFNITGTCYPEEHYMMDDSRRFGAIMEMVEYGEYFVINRPRQYGKTTMLHAAVRALREDKRYLPILMSFQAVSSAAYENDISFARFFYQELCYILENTDEFEEKASLAQLPFPSTMEEFSKRITEIVKITPRKLVLLIDETDASSNYDAFLHLLATLRRKFLNRKDPKDYTFHSVVLAGVHDIKSLKFKLRNPDDAQTNSPWNIATDFKVVMEFYPNEIAYMLRQYSEAENVQMDFTVMSEKLYYYTSGYPFLVSKLCKTIAEEILPEKEDKSQWTLEDLERSVQMLMRETNTNFDSLIKNLENHAELKALVEAVLLEGFKMPFNPHVPEIRMGLIYGIFKTASEVQIHNRIYEQLIYNYLTAIRLKDWSLQRQDNYRDNFLDANGKLELKKILQKFQSFLKEQYSERNRSLMEREWRLIFLAFLKPIINGKGHDFKEVETSEEKRMDIVVTYLQEKYIIELKIWRGEESHKKGLQQLSNYLNIHGVTKGWLIIFDNRKNKSRSEEVIHFDGKEIFAVWV
jgi:hypothetical protein